MRKQKVDSLKSDEYVESIIKYVYDICLAKHVISVLGDFEVKNVLFDIWKCLSDKIRAGAPAKGWVSFLVIFS